MANKRRFGLNITVNQASVLAQVIEEGIKVIGPVKLQGANADILNLPAALRETVRKMQDAETDLYFEYTSGPGEPLVGLTKCPIEKATL